MTTPARLIQTQQLHFLRKTIDFSLRGVAQTVGCIPAGSVICYPASGATVTTLFNGSGTDLLTIGIVGTANQYATAVDVSSVGFKALNQNVATLLVSVDTVIIATYTDANSDATTGSMEVVITYTPDTDQ